MLSAAAAISCTKIGNEPLKRRPFEEDIWGELRSIRKGESPGKTWTPSSAGAQGLGKWDGAGERCHSGALLLEIHLWAFGPWDGWALAPSICVYRSHHYGSFNHHL